MVREWHQKINADAKRKFKSKKKETMYQAAMNSLRLSDWIHDEAIDETDRTAGHDTHDNPDDEAKYHHNG